MKWIFIALVLLGDILVINLHSFGFILWIAVDSYFALNSFLEGRIEEMMIFLLYSIMGIYGLLNWSKYDTF